MEILLENQGKSGVYIWENKINGNRYIGSSINLTFRLMRYFNSNHLLKYANMNICKALLKHGYSNFSLSILEHCESNKCLEREQYYIDLFKPEYNILQRAGSSLGYKHTEEAIAKIVAAKKGKKLNPKWIAKIVAAAEGRKSPMEGKKHLEKTLKKMSEAKKGKNHPIFGKIRPFLAGSPALRIEVKDLLTNESTM